LEKESGLDWKSDHLSDEVKMFKKLKGKVYAAYITFLDVLPYKWSRSEAMLKEYLDKRKIRYFAIHKVRMKDIWTWYGMYSRFHEVRAMNVK
jgi:hypothetical protein